MNGAVWLHHDVATAYAGILDLDASVMTLSSSPYLLARIVVGKYLGPLSPRSASRHAGARVLVLDHRGDDRDPDAAWCLDLIARAQPARDPRHFLRRYRWQPLLLFSAVAPAVRGRARRGPSSTPFAIAFTIWSSDWAHRRRTSWTWTRSAARRRRRAASSSAGLPRATTTASWQLVTQNFKPDLDLGALAVGAYAVGLGVILAGTRARSARPGSRRAARPSSCGSSVASRSPASDVRPL